MLREELQPVEAVGAVPGAAVEQELRFVDNEQDRVLLERMRPEGK